MPVTWAELTTVAPGDFTILTVPDVLEDRGDAWADIDDEVGDVAGALELWQRDVDERGLGELNFPPDYPKMPGEPPRVQPSKRRTDKADAEYMAPKAERDAAERERWGMPVVPPVPPMLAKAVKGIAALEGQDVSFEPKWDGFRSIIFRSGDLVEIGSRNEKPMTRYFPEVVEAALANLPERCVVDGEIIVVRPGEDRLDFELLSQRIHPAASRVKKLSVETPAQFVAFDLLALGDDDLTGRPFRERRALLEQALADAKAPIHLTAATTDRDVAAQWFTEFEGAGLDGLVAKQLDGTYEPDKRTMAKIKHERTADCVVAGYRTHKSGDDLIGSLLLGIHDDDGQLLSVGVIGAFPMARRKELFDELQPLVTDLRRPPVGLGAPGGGHPHPAERRRQQVGGRQGPLLHPAAPRAGRRGALRPHGGRPLPAHRAVRALAPRQGPRRVHLRPARRAGLVRPVRGAQRRRRVTEVPAGRRVRRAAVAGAAVGATTAVASGAGLGRRCRLVRPAGAHPRPAPPRRRRRARRGRLDRAAGHHPRDRGARPLRAVDRRRLRARAGG